MQLLRVCTTPLPHVATTFPGEQSRPITAVNYSEDQKCGDGSTIVYHPNPQKKLTVDKKCRPLGFYLILQLHPYQIVKRCQVSAVLKLALEKSPRVPDELVQARRTNRHGRPIYWNRFIT